MIKSMTGFAREEVKENGATVTLEIKALNGRYLDINCRLPKYLIQKELEIREAVKKVIERGSLTISVNIEADESIQPFNLDEKTAVQVYKSLNKLKTKLKIRETVKMEHLLLFSNTFTENGENDQTEFFWTLTSQALTAAIRNLDNMRKNEGRNISRDIQRRVKMIQKTVENIEALGIERIPEERDRLRQRVAQLFESDEIDEQRLQIEMVLLADKLDISEECVRLNSHINYFFKIIKSREASGKKLNFLLQEMHREINTIGSKINDAKISQLVVDVKEELERVREQVQNIE